jgi:hypothetical protein
MATIINGVSRPPEIDCDDSLSDPRVITSVHPVKAIPGHQRFRLLEDAHLGQLAYPHSWIVGSNTTLPVGECGGGGHAHEKRNDKRHEQQIELLEQLNHLFAVNRSFFGVCLKDFGQGRIITVLLSFDIATATICFTFFLHC